MNAVRKHKISKPKNSRMFRNRTYRKNKMNPPEPVRWSEQNNPDVQRSMVDSELLLNHLIHIHSHVKEIEASLRNLTKCLSQTTKKLQMSGLKSDFISMEQISNSLKSGIYSGNVHNLSSGFGSCSSIQSIPLPLLPSVKCASFNSFIELDLLKWDKNNVNNTSSETSPQQSEQDHLCEGDHLMTQKLKKQQTVCGHNCNVESDSELKTGTISVDELSSQNHCSDPLTFESLAVEHLDYSNGCSNFTTECDQTPMSAKFIFISGSDLTSQNDSLQLQDFHHFLSESSWEDKRFFADSQIGFTLNNDRFQESLTTGLMKEDWLDDLDDLNSGSSLLAAAGFPTGKLSQIIDPVQKEDLLSHTSTYISDSIKGQGDLGVDTWGSHATPVNNFNSPFWCSHADADSEISLAYQFLQFGISQETQVECANGLKHDAETPVSKLDESSHVKYEKRSSMKHRLKSSTPELDNATDRIRVDNQELLESSEGGLLEDQNEGSALVETHITLKKNVHSENTKQDHQAADQRNGLLREGDCKPVMIVPRRSLEEAPEEIATKDEYYEAVSVNLKPFQAPLKLNKCFFGTSIEDYKLHDFSDLLEDTVENKDIDLHQSRDLLKHILKSTTPVGWQEVLTKSAPDTADFSQEYSFSRIYSLPCSQTDSSLIQEVCIMLVSSDEGNSASTYSGTGNLLGAQAQELLSTSNQDVSQSDGQDVNFDVQAEGVAVTVHTAQSEGQRPTIWQLQPPESTEEKPQAVLSQTDCRQYTSENSRAMLFHTEDGQSTSENFRAVLSHTENGQNTSENSTAMLSHEEGGQSTSENCRAVFSETEYGHNSAKNSLQEAQEISFENVSYSATFKAMSDSQKSFDVSGFSCSANLLANQTSTSRFLQDGDTKGQQETCGLSKEQHRTFSQDPEHFQFYFKQKQEDNGSTNLLNNSTQHQSPCTNNTSIHTVEQIPFDSSKRNVGNQVIESNSHPLSDEHLSIRATPARSFSHSLPGTHFKISYQAPHGGHTLIAGHPAGNKLVSAHTQEGAAPISNILPSSQTINCPNCQQPSLHPIPQTTNCPNCQQSSMHHVPRAISCPNCQKPSMYHTQTISFPNCQNASMHHIPQTTNYPYCQQPSMFHAPQVISKPYHPQVSIHKAPQTDSCHTFQHTYHTLRQGQQNNQSLREYPRAIKNGSLVRWQTDNLQLMDSSEDVQTPELNLSCLSGHIACSTEAASVVDDQHWKHDVMQPDSCPLSCEAASITSPWQPALAENSNSEVCDILDDLSLHSGASWTTIQRQDVAVHAVTVPFIVEDRLAFDEIPVQEDRFADERIQVEEDRQFNDRIHIEAGVNGSDIDLRDIFEGDQHQPAAGHSLIEQQHNILVLDVLAQGRVEAPHDDFDVLDPLLQHPEERDNLGFLWRVPRGLNIIFPLEDDVDIHDDMLNPLFQDQPTLDINLEARRRVDFRTF